jgi:uncharacterized MAPEG superfamily protein
VIPNQLFAFYFPENITMSVAFYCVLAAGLMPFVWTVVAKASGPRYNNFKTRIWQNALEGLPQRAHAAHLNSFEAFPFFAAAVIVAHLHHADTTYVNNLALTFIGLRLCYGIAYLANKAYLRSLIWLVAMACCILIFLAGR